MEYVRLGSTELSVSVAGLGCGGSSRLGTVTGNSKKDSINIVKRALELGVNFFDTANSYSDAESEVFLGKALKGRRRHVVLATKFSNPMGPGPNDSGMSRVHMMNAIEDSLSRLQTDYVDLYYIHHVDYQTPLEEMLRAMDDLVTTGKVRYIGCCNFAAWQVCKALWTADNLKADPLICVQNPYNLLDRRLENEMFGLIRDQGLGSMAYSPLANGRLTNLGDIDVLDDSKTHSVVTKLSQIASKIDKTMAQIALNWVVVKLLAPESSKVQG